MVCGGFLVDLLFVFYLLNRRIGVFGFIVVSAFHFMNVRLFDSGIFPWFMIAATLIVFGPDCPVGVLNDIKLKHSYRWPALLLGLVVGFLVGGFLPERFDLVQALIGGLGVAVAAYHLDEPFRQAIGTGYASNAGKSRTGPSHPRLPGWQKWSLGLLGLWLGLQVLIPLRHLAISGLVRWTEEGHHFLEYETAR